MSIISKERIPIIAIVVGVLAIVLGAYLHHHGKKVFVATVADPKYKMSLGAKISLYGGIIVAIIGAVMYYLAYKAAKAAAASPAAEAEFYDF